MKRVLLKISYDGTAYHGWQVQPNGITVQETLQNSLKKLTSEKIAITGCSRTDAGVHAREFYCHIDCEDKFPPNAFLKGLNSLLPDDICVIGCQTVNSDFHARYDAKGKTYIYSFYHGILDPFKSRYQLHIDKIPDINLMNEFCHGVIGTHDFTPFSSSKRTVTDTVRTVSECCVGNENNDIYFKITADGFLYNMVRIIAGTALSVGYKRLKTDCYNEIFKTLEREKAGDTLQPHGLILDKVYY